MNEKRGAQRLLLVIGAVLIVGGAITWVVAGNAIQHASLVDGFSTALGMGSSDGVSSGTVWMWVGIVSCILGVLLFLTVLIIRAASGSPLEEGPERLTLSQTRRRQTER